MSDSIDISRIDLGIDGLDEMIEDGIPAGSMISTIGAAGTGKTILSLQFLKHAIDGGEPALMISLEQSEAEVLETADSFGWDFRTHVENDDLVIVDMDPVDMAAGLKNIGDDLRTVVRDFGASRLVLDSVSLLEMMYDENARRRQEVYAFTSYLKDAEIDTLLTSEVHQTDPTVSRYGLVEYLTDAVIVLQYHTTSDLRNVELMLEIKKIRNTKHARGNKPYEITENGINVHEEGVIF